MKYKDKGFIKYQEKQRNDEVGFWSNKSERQRRREKGLNFGKFYQNFLIGKIDKFWWNNLRESDKEKVMSLHQIQEHAIKNSLDHWYSDPVFETWDEWFDYIKTTFETNKVKFREDKLKVLGI